MVSEENYTIYYFEFFEFVCAKYIKYNNCYVYITSLCLKADVIAKDVMAYCQVTDVMVTLVLVADVKSGGLAKACVPGKNYSVSEKIELLNEYQTE